MNERVNSSIHQKLMISFSLVILFDIQINPNLSEFLSNHRYKNNDQIFLF